MNACPSPLRSSYLRIGCVWDCNLAPKERPSLCSQLHPMRMVLVCLGFINLRGIVLILSLSHGPHTRRVLHKDAQETNNTKELCHGNRFLK